MEKKNSGVGVLDKAVTILGTLESGPHSLAELVAATGIARPTAHRLAVALEHHRLVTRDLQGRFVLGPRSGELAAAAVKIVYSPPLPQHLPRYAMPPVNLHSYIVAKAISVSVLPLPNVYLVFATQCQLAHR